MQSARVCSTNFITVGNCKVVTGVEAILFDLDGTLIDSASDIAHVCNEIAVENGFQYQELDQIGHLVGRGSRGIMARASGLPEESETVLRLRDLVLKRYAQCGYPNTQLFPAIRPLMKAINQSPLRWGIVTSKPVLHSLQIVERDLELQGRAVLIGVEDVQEIKPSPEGLLLALERLQLAAWNCLYVGDNRVDVLAARRAGMACIGVGYGYCSEQDHPLRFDPDYYAETPQDLVKLIASLFYRQIAGLLQKPV